MHDLEKKWSKVRFTLDNLLPQCGKTKHKELSFKEYWTQQLIRAIAEPLFIMDIQRI